MVKDLKFGQMELNMMGNTKMAKKKEMGNCTLQMDHFMRVFYGLTQIGQFHDNDIEGYGVYTWPDKRIYVGYWIKNKMHGTGELKWPDGRLYKGVMN